jgi:excisionase family DNA binding protein
MSAIIVRRWLSKEEAAEYLGASESTIRRLEEAGKIHPSKTTESLYRGRRRYDIRDLDAYMESMRMDRDGPAKEQPSRKRGR